ncbi:MAG: hypothetical protein LBI98_00185 [Endomicrobium sp.]|nr:hypothetical protein [Endomicrobium sp.]
MKKLVLLTAFVAVFSLSLSACGKKKTEVPSEEIVTGQQDENASQEVAESQSSGSLASSDDQSGASK